MRVYLVQQTQDLQSQMRLIYLNQTVIILNYQRSQPPGSNYLCFLI